MGEQDVSVVENLSNATPEEPKAGPFGGGLFSRLIQGAAAVVATTAERRPNMQEETPAPTPAPQAAEQAAEPAKSKKAAELAKSKKTPQAAGPPPPEPVVGPPPAPETRQRQESAPIDYAALPLHSAADLAKHGNRKSLWLVINNLVYDVTDWQKLHPGGAAALLQYAGRDATEAAAAAHGGSQKAASKMQEFVIGIFDHTTKGDLESQDDGLVSVVRGTAKKVIEPMFSPRAGRPDRPDVSLRPQDPPLPPVPGRSTVGPGAAKAATNEGVRTPAAASVPPPLAETVGAPDAERNLDEGEEGEEMAAGAFDLGTDIETHVFEELRLEQESIGEARRAWEAFCASQGSKEAAGEAIYNALFEGAPSLQALFTTPRAVQAIRFVSVLQSFISVLDDPKKLKAEVESLAFAHLNIEVTIPRIAVFRDAILELLEIEIGEAFNERAKAGWYALLNYIGGAIVYIKMYFQERLGILASSWKKANEPDSGNADRKAEDRQALEEKEETSDKDDDDDDVEQGNAIDKGKQRWWNKKMAKNAGGGGNDNSNTGGDASSGAEFAQSVTVVRTFEAMFEFNAAVMGYQTQGNGVWMREVAGSFDAIVTNISSTSRLQEECDMLVLKIGSRTKGEVNLGNFKSCMLATLRSLLPKDWDSNHEVAWNWLWDNVERLLRMSMGKPPHWLREVKAMMETLDDDTKYKIRKTFYQKFFVAAPLGQEFFKQSDTRLHFIADRIMVMVQEMYEEPHRMVDDLSSVGLRHVGYGIPTELFNPFVNCIVEVMGEFTNNPMGIEGYRWSLSLIAKIMVRTICEGSTIVMKAINANSLPMLKRALACAPRASRTSWLLKVEAGTQSISPLMWAIESGRLEAAEAIIQDLLVIRADRERYYYGVEDIFTRHPDVIKRLLSDAPMLLPVLLQGLVWRSRIAQDGMRRVNYYVKHLLVNQEDDSVSETLSWLVGAKNPRTMAHEVIVLVSDTMWNGLICRQFIYSKIWFMISLLVFMLSQAILPKSDNADELPVRIVIFLFRIVIYAVTMTRLMSTHAKFSIRAYKEGDTMTFLRCFRIPSYLKDPRDSGGFILMLFLICMCVTEPMFWCLPQAAEEFPSTTCDNAEGILWVYSVFNTGALFLHWVLLVDLSVFSTGLSAFVLVIGQVLSEMTRFLATFLWLLLTFGSAISVLEHPYFEMRDIPNSVICLFSITVRLFEDDFRDMLETPTLLMAVFVFVTASAVVLLNLLIAQINCSYVFIYQDMVGFARLNRADVICETLEKAHDSIWTNFVKTMGLDKPLEFNEGDVGLAGGIQVLEQAGLHAVTEDAILRFGGSCALDIPWPEEAANEEDDHYNRISKLLKKVLRKVGKAKSHGKQQQSGGSGAGDSSSVLDTSMVSNSDGNHNSDLDLSMASVPE